MPGGMVRRRRKMPKPFDNGWTITETFRHNGRVLTPGRKLTVSGLRRGTGPVRFVRFVDNNKGGQWVDVVSAGGRRHAVTLDRIKAVHNR